MTKRLRFIAAVGALTALIAATAAYGAGLFPGFPIGGGASYCNSWSGYPTTPTTPGTTVPTPNQCNNQVPAGPALTGNEYYPADTQTPGTLGQTAPSTILIPGTAVAGSTWANSRNLLGNGSLNGTQVNGTSAVTCATTSSPTSSALSADRWVCDVNVGSGIGTTTVITASPAPPAGFVNSVKVVKGSSSLAQPICVWQAVPKADSVSVQGQTVTFSAYVAALAAMDNGNIANLVVISGTGTDQGFNGAWTATPAITPAWTGISTLVNTPISLTTAFARFQTQAVVPAAATEIGVGVCWTPAATAGAATDGLAFTGAQLERGNSASLFEYKTRAKEIQENEAFVYALSETAGPSVVAMCTELVASTNADCYLQYPVQMYKTPTVNLLNCGTACFAMPTTVAQTAFTSTCVLTVNATLGTYAQTTNGTYLNCVQSGTTATPAGLALPLVMSASGTGEIIAWTGL